MKSKWNANVISFIKWLSFFKWKERTLTLDAIFIYFRLRTCFFKKTRHQSFQHWTNSTCISVVIVRGLCDVCRNINSVTFVTDEQNTLSLCPEEAPVNNLTCILRTLYLQMSGQKSMSKMRSCVAQDSGNHGRRLSSNDWPYHYL